MIWTYYYMGFVLDDLDQRPEAVVYLKKGESLALKNQESHKDILHHIYQCLTFMNMNAKEYDLAKRYGYLALKYGHCLNDVRNEATDLSNMSSIYSDIGNKDSAYYYINRIIPLLDSVPSSKYALYCGNIGIEAMGRDDEKAKYYLLKSIEKENDPYFCKALAQIYTKEGNKEKADEMWHKALDTKDLSLKANVVKGMAKAKTEEGDYKAAHELDLWAAALKDSLHRQQKEETCQRAAAREARTGSMGDSRIAAVSGYPCRLDSMEETEEPPAAGGHERGTGAEGENHGAAAAGE